MGVDTELKVFANDLN